MGADQYVLVLSLMMAGISSPVKSAFEAKDEAVVIYIKPSPDAPCPADTCYTLSQFAADQSRLFQLNTTLLFLSGNHSLNSTMIVTEITFFSMLSVSSSTPMIKCQQESSITLRNVSNVLVRGLTFYGCGNNKITSVDHLTVHCCSFIGTENSSSALNIIRSNAVLTNSSFLFNRNGMYHGPLMIREIQHAPLHSNFSLYARVGGALIANQSNVSLVGSKFVGNQAEIGRAIFSTLGSRVVVENCTFDENYVCLFPYKDIDHYALCFGGVLFCENEHNRIEIVDSEFSRNRGFYGGVLTIFNRCTIYINSSRFSENSAMKYPGSGGVLFLQYGVNVSIHKSLFFNNRASSESGAIHIEQSLLTVSDSKFIYHSVRQFGGVFLMSNGNLTISNSYFSNSSAFQGGVINASPHCIVSIYDSEFTNNEVQSDVDPSSATGGAIFIRDSSVLNIVRTLFHNNSATSGGAISLSSSTELNIVDCRFEANRAIVGGAIEAYQSDVTFFGSCNLTENAVYSKGGTIYATGDSLLKANGVLTIMYNEANDSGGGIYLYRSKLNCQLNSTIQLIGNEAAGKGGGIFAINSMVKVFSDRDSSTESSILFERNTATMGGGIYLELATEVHVVKSGNDYTKTIYNLRFVENVASYGGAIYNADETNYEICNSNSYHGHTGTECFLQILAPVQTYYMKYNFVTTEFINNSAEMSGSALYGGLLDRCTLLPSAEILLTTNRVIMDGVTYFLNTSNLNNTNDISSSPVQLCFCGPDISVPNCSLQQWNISTMRGRRFQVPLVAVNQVNRTLPNVTVYSSLRYAESGLGEGEMAQVTTDECSLFSFTIFSSQPQEEITLYAENPCRNATKSQKKITVSFSKCTCPIGFQPNKFENNDCVCDCDSGLRKYVTNCSSQTDSLIREGNFWISYLNRTTSTTGYYYLTYPQCPLDYCHPPNYKVQINLTLVNGADAQCSNHRSGILCGKCIPDHCLSLGSSRCFKCTKCLKSLVQFLLLVPLSGICLVVLMLILNLTVAVGTLNGLIFYANIIEANSSTFFSSSSWEKDKARLMRIFVSWLNLDIGFDACIFDGMDTYWKTWIQLAFPTYLILLVLFVILLSQRSMRFTRLISKKNPVATLATVILLSYAGFLRTIITTLSYVTLTYPDGDRRLWLPDATVAYLEGRHIWLFIAAILILLMGVVYTFLLFSWQWLLVINGVSTRCQLLNQFIEVYHAPYRTEHRYWTGLLLLLRVVLYLIFSLGNPSLNLLAIIAIMCGLLFLKAHLGRIYDKQKNRIIDTVEMVSYLNIGLFSAATFFAIQTNKYQTEAAFTSVLTTIVLFISILVFHIHKELLSKWRAALKRKFNKNHATGLYANSHTTTPTFSTVDGIPRGNCLHSIMDNTDRTESGVIHESASHLIGTTQNGDQVDEKDTMSVNSMTPLLKH